MKYPTIFLLKSFQFFYDRRTGHTKTAVDRVLQNKIMIADNLVENKNKKYIIIHNDQELYTRALNYDIYDIYDK